MRRGGLGKVEGAGWKGQGAIFLSQRFWASRIPFLALTIGINRFLSFSQTRKYRHYSTSLFLLSFQTLVNTLSG